MNFDRHFIDNGKSPHEHSCWLHSDTPYGNLLLKQWDIIGRIDHINQTIKAVYNTFYLVNNTLIFNPDPNSHRFIEEVIYWLKKTADELIALSEVLTFKVKEGYFPELKDKNKMIKQKKLADSIYSYFEIYRTGGWLEMERPFLETLNSYANAYKHSFTNTITAVTIGIESPVAFASHEKEMKDYIGNFPDLIKSFSLFYQKAMQEIKIIALQLQSKEVKVKDF